MKTMDWPYGRWQTVYGITKPMVYCTLLHLTGLLDSIIVEISNNGQYIQFLQQWPMKTLDNDGKVVYLRLKNVHPDTTVLNGDTYNSSMPGRIRGMKSGIRQAIDYAFQDMRIESFPDMLVLFSVGDTAKTENDDATTPFCVHKNISYPWAPIMAQNRLDTPSNLMVLTPDFTFFTDFLGGHDHGRKDDVWFDVMADEAMAAVASSVLGNHHQSLVKSAIFSAISYPEKQNMVVYRGSFNPKTRLWAPLRRALLPFKGCVSNGMMDVRPRIYLSKSAMCQGYKMVLTLPGNGIWSWATKFNLLCNSVTMMVSPLALNGESWEIRKALGLRPGVHYLAVDSRASHICEDVKAKVNWTLRHPAEAQAIAEAGRNVMLTRLDRPSVLRDLATLLLGYASLNRSTTLSPTAVRYVEELFDHRIASMSHLVKNQRKSRVAV